MPALARRYDGHETAVTLSPASSPEQVRAPPFLLAACQPDVRAFFNFELVDEHRLAGWQSGLDGAARAGRPAQLARRRGGARLTLGVVHLCGPPLD